MESKFNTAQLNSLQRNARPNVLTEGGLIVDKTTNAQAGRAANALINGAIGTGGAQTNTK